MRTGTFGLAALLVTILWSPRAWPCWGLRAMSSGGAFTAVADDANAAYWNVAGLAQLESFELAISSEVIGYDWYSGSMTLFNQLDSPNAYFQTANLGVPVSDRVGLGLSAEWSGQGSYMVNPGVGVRLSKRHYAGLRLSYWNVGDYPWYDEYYSDVSVGASDLAADVDLLWNINDKWAVGLHIEGFASLAGELSAGTIPLIDSNYRPGVAYRPNDKLLLMASLYDLLWGMPPGVSMGAEYLVREGDVALRGGVYNVGLGLDPGMGTTGVGYRINERHEIGYGLLFWLGDPHPIGWSHSLGYHYKRH